MADLQCGAVIWRATGGEGEFQGASGLITSNFCVNANCEAVDNNYARIFSGSRNPAKWKSSPKG